MTFASCIRMLAGLVLMPIVAGSAIAAQPFKYQGFNMMAFSKADYADQTLVASSLDYIQSRGSNLVVIDWNVAFDDDGRILPQTSPSTSEPPRADITRLVTLARQRGLRVFLKPHIAFPDNPFGNRGTWNSDMTRFSMDTFFRDWSAYLVGLGGMATSLGVDAIAIGAENLGFDSANRDQWLALISSLRAVYKGNVTYGAHFLVDDATRFTDVCFWDAVDIIGLSLYVALSKNDHASLQELNEAWHTNPYGTFGDVVEYLRLVSESYNKPVMALEGGYQSIAGGLFDVGPVTEIRPVDNGVQAAGFASYLDTLSKYQGSWFWGLSIWVAYPPHFDPANQTHWGFTQGYGTNSKPAAEVIRRYFTGELTYADPSFAGPDGGARIFAGSASDWVTAGAGDDFISGGTGDDVIVAGPAVLTSRASATVVISAVGDIRESGGPKLRLVVNEQVIGNWNEVTAARGSTPQRFTLTVPLSSRVESFRIETLPDPEFANGVNRFVTIASISVNGIPLSESEGSYTAAVGFSGVGSWSRIYSGIALVQDVSFKQAAFFGARTDNDVIVGGPGNDTIDGGTGIDAVVFSGARANYTITPTLTAYVVRDNVGVDGTDTLTNIELGQFADDVVDLRTDGRLVPVVEFYNASLDHYFITWTPAERVNLYLRKTPTPWVPSGLSFNAYASGIAASSPVCRYYLPPQFGDSHFFGRGSAECNATGAQHPQFVLEDSQFMYLKLPQSGTCPADTNPVYRVFSNRLDANHRYTTDIAVRDVMVSKGWLAEGDGPDRIVLCAP